MIKKILISAALSSLLGICSLALAKEVTIHGFVTEIKSPTSFEIDDYKVTRSKTVELQLGDDKEEQASRNFNAEDIRVGTELEIKGEYDEATRELQAKSIKAFFKDTRVVKRNALLEKIPLLSKKDGEWEGEIRSDGQRIAVLPTTLVTFKPNKSERKKSPDKTDDADSSKLTTLDVLNLDTFVHYEGIRRKDGCIEASRVEFQHAELEGGEAKMWKRFEPKQVKQPDYANLVPGELKMHWKKYRLVPNEEAQQYIARIGESLIPQHQKDLPAGDPLKIPFRFYLVEAKSFNAAAYPNGVVVVHSGVFNCLENQAQLAFVMSHEISHAVEKHTWQNVKFQRDPRLIALRAGGAFIPFGGALVTTMAASAIQSSFMRSLENQADRVGLEWMLAAGYDIREAPASWKALALKEGDEDVGTNPLWDTHSSYTERRSYLMAELKNNYGDVDYSNLKRDSAEFHDIADVVKETEGAKGKKGK